MEFLGLLTPWEVWKLASKCGLPETKIRFSSNSAKLSPPAVHPDGLGQAPAACYSFL